MPPNTTVFEPINTADYVLAIICTVIAIVAIISLIILNRKPQHAKIQNPVAAAPANKFKPLASLGLFFVFLICAATAFFSWLTTIKVTPVTVNEDYIETNFGKVKWDNIQRIYVHDDKTVAPFSGQEVGKATKILMIVEMDGKTHALSELNYDIKEMSKTIEKIRKEKLEMKNEE